MPWLRRTAPPVVLGYRSYGTRHRFLIRGRALAHARQLSPEPHGSWWRNLREALKRFHVAPMPHAPTRATIAAMSSTLVGDDEGFLERWVELAVPAAATGWQDVQLHLLDGSGQPLAGARRGICHVLVPADSARFGVISDLDDTVLQSKVATPLHAARLMLFENSRTRLPFPGVAALYRALVAGVGGDEGNPIFYVSSSPWNVHDVLRDFLDAQGIPLGPLLLRDWDLDRSLRRTAAHKRTLIREVLSTFPAMPFLLVGDTSQEDPEIYADMLREHPGRILGIYIRDVGASATRRAAVEALIDVVREAGATLVLAPHTLDIANDAAARGWIDAARLGEVGHEKQQDEGAAPGKASLAAPR